VKLLAALHASLQSEKLRFLLIGGYNTAFGFGLFAGLLLLAGDRVHYMIILPVSHAIAVTNAYFAYRFFVFRDGARGLKSYLRFHVVYLASLGFSMLALPLLVEIGGCRPILAQGIVLAVTVVMSYVLHKRFSFSQ
jgi:putative flippase GtrA